MIVFSKTDRFVSVSKKFPSHIIVMFHRMMLRLKFFMLPYKLAVVHNNFRQIYWQFSESVNSNFS